MLDTGSTEKIESKESEPEDYKQYHHAMRRLSRSLKGTSNAQLIEKYQVR